MSLKKRQRGVSVRNLLLVVLLTALVFQASSCGTNSNNSVCTLRLVIECTPTSLNPHTVTDHDSRYILSCCSTPLVRRVNGSETSSWKFEAATEITDVTSELSRETRTIWSIKGDNGRAFRITLDPRLCWDDGTPITAEDYVASMELLLSPERHNPNAKLFTKGNTAIKNGSEYYDSGAPVLKPVVTPYTDAAEADYSFDINSGVVFFPLFTGTTLSSVTVREYAERGLLSHEIYDKLLSYADAYGLVPYSSSTRDIVHEAIKEIVAALGVFYDEEILKESLVLQNGNEHIVPFSEVGIFTEDDISFIYITEQPAKMDEVLSLLENIWLVRTDLYDEEVDEDSEADKTHYGTSAESFSSFGPYMIEKITNEGITLKRNPNWCERSLADEKEEYQADRVVFRVLSYSDSISGFFAGTIDVLTLRDAEAESFIASGLTPLSDDGNSFASSRVKVSADDPVRTCSFRMNDEEWKSFLLSHSGTALPGE